MYSKELIKGTLSAIILKILDDNGRMYGYQMIQAIKELSGHKILVKDGSLYPALHKLKKEGLVNMETEHIGKRVRHYYYLTEKGQTVRWESELDLRDFIVTMRKIFMP